MSVVAGALSGSVPFEIAGIKPNSPFTAARGRGTSPTYANAALTTSNIVQVQVPVATSSDISGGGTQTVSGSIIIPTYSGLKLGVADTGQFTISNVQIPTDLSPIIASHVSASVIGTQSNQPQPQPGNLLIPGTTYPSLSLYVSMTLFNSSGSSQGVSFYVTASVALHGTVTN